MNTNALLGYTGFVGSNLLAQFEDLKSLDLYNSKNLKFIRNKTFNTILCACVPGFKYIANRYPDSDLHNIKLILDDLKTIKCDKFILISSQDCNSTLYSDEDFTGKPPTVYGVNRLFFENQLKSIFKDKLYILRIGCLFGKNLKKNVIYDLLNNHYLDHLTEDYTMQLYSLENLKKDIYYIISNDIHLINRFSEPVYISEIVEIFNSLGYTYDFKLTKNTYKNYSNKSKYGKLLDKTLELEKLYNFVRSYD